VAGIFIAYGGNVTGWKTSTDGFTWTQRGVSAEVIWAVLLDGGTIFAAMVRSGVGGVATSTDGITFTSLAPTFFTGAAAPDALAFIGTRLVAVYPTYSVYSDDRGVTWTTGGSFAGTSQMQLASSGSVLITCTNGTAANPIYYYSTDGSTWTARATTFSGGFVSLAWNPHQVTPVIFSPRFTGLGRNGDMIAISANGASYSIIYSVGLTNTGLPTLTTYCKARFDAYSGSWYVPTPTGTYLATTDEKWVNSGIPGGEAFAFNDDDSIAVLQQPNDGTKAGYKYSLDASWATWVTGSDWLTYAPFAGSATSAVYRLVDFLSGIASGPPPVMHGTGTLILPTFTLLLPPTPQRLWGRRNGVIERP
jgi:hypothetical protein